MIGLCLILDGPFETQEAWFHRMGRTRCFPTGVLVWDEESLEQLRDTVKYLEETEDEPFLVVVMTALKGKEPYKIDVKVCTYQFTVPTDTPTGERIIHLVSNKMETYFTRQKAMQ